MKNKNLKELYKATFNTVAKGYEHQAMRFFSDTAIRIPSYLNLTGDEHVLDVATGTGFVAFTLADKLPQGKVIGIDLSEGMLAEARKKQKHLDIKNITFKEMDMQSLNFVDNHFDMAVSSFSIFFVQDMQTQLEHISKKIKHGGDIIITTFSKESFTPLVLLLFERFKAYGVEIPPLTGEKVNTEEKCVTLFQQAGLKNIWCKKIDCGYYLDDFEMWWYLVWNAGFRGFVNQLNPTDLQTFKQEHEKEISTLITDKGIWLEMHILYTKGKK